MEEILYELGLARYSDVLKQKSVTFNTFKQIINSNANQKMMRERLMQECGLNSGEIIAIMGKVAQILEKHSLLNQSNSLTKSPLTPTLSYNSKAPNASRRALLLQQ